jgi:hypothetical protein
MFRNLTFSIRWKKSVSAVLSSLLLSINVFVPLFFVAAPALAQTQPIPPLQVTQTQLRAASVRLKSVETLFDKVESQRLVKLEDSETVSQATFEYVKAMKSALDNALKSAELAARTEGKQGSITPLDTFEKAEKANEPRLQQIEQRATRIDNSIKAGNILIEKPAIEKLSIVERRELFNSLQPPARQIYIQKQPDLFKPVLEAPQLEVPQKELKPLDKPSENQQSILPSAQNTIKHTNYYVGMVVSNTLQSISNALVPPAYAAVAAGCVGLVVSKNWKAASACVVKAGSEATNIYNQFVSCWNSAKGWSKWFKRASCMARVAIKLG